MLNEIFVFERLDYLIRTGKAGSRKELAGKFSVIERTISRWIEFMNNYGSEIFYCRTRMSYRYKNLGRFNISVGFTVEKC